MLKRKYSLLLFLLFLFCSSNAQTLKGGQYNFGFANGLKTEWYLNQFISNSSFSKVDNMHKADTIYLTKDLNGNGLPDLKWSFKLNAWRSVDSEEDKGNDIVLLTVSFKAKNGNVYEGSDIKIYQQYKDLIKVISDTATYATQPVEKVNAFYRYSKVILQNTSVRAITSQPLLLEAPENYKQLGSRTAKVQILFISKIAKYKSCDCRTKSDYFYYPCENDDFSIASKSNFNWVRADDNCLIDVVRQESTVSSCLINWGNERLFSKSIIEMILKW